MTLNPAAKYFLKTFGVPELRNAEGAPVSLALGKPFALLIYLALNPRAPAREDLAMLLWDGIPREKALQSTRQALFLIRKTLGEIVAYGKQGISIFPGLIDSDLAQLSRELAADRLEAARALYAGPFLERFTIAGAPEWTHWVERVRARSNSALADALAAGAEREAGAGRIGSALDHLRKVLQIDPYRSEAHARFIELLLATRELGEASHALSDARHALPEPEFKATWDTFGQQLRGLARLRHEVREPRFSQPELADAIALWKKTRDGASALLYLSGPAMQKTRLLEEIVTYASADGGSCVIAETSEFRKPVQLGTISSLVNKLLALPGAAGISADSDRTLRAFAGEPVTQMAAISEAVSDLLAAVAYEKPCLIGIDGFQWADEPSRSVLSDVIRACSAHPVLFVITASSTELSDEWFRMLESLLKNATSHRLLALNWAMLSAGQAEP